jgi:hypothetical protein
MQLARILAPLIAIVAASTGVISVREAPRDRVGVDARPASGPEPLDSTPDLAWLSIAAAEANPFRRTRMRVSPGYDVRREEATPAVEDVEPPLPPPVPRPDWILTAIIWGSEPVAVFEGIEGSPDSRIVAPGDTVGELVIAGVTADSVVVVQEDTSWTFRVVAPWNRTVER